MVDVTMGDAEMADAGQHAQTQQGPVQQTAGVGAAAAGAVGPAGGAYQAHGLAQVGGIDVSLVPPSGAAPVPLAGTLAPCTTPVSYPVGAADVAGSAPMGAVPQPQMGLHGQPLTVTPVSGTEPPLTHVPPTTADVLSQLASTVAQLQQHVARAQAVLTTVVSPTPQGPPTTRLLPLPVAPAEPVSEAQRLWTELFDSDPNSARFFGKGSPGEGRQWVHSLEWHFTLPLRCAVVERWDVQAARDQFAMAGLMHQHDLTQSAAVLAAGTEVSAGGDLKGKAKVGEPTKFVGRDSRKTGMAAVYAVAQECESFLCEVEDYVQLTAVPPAGQARVAATYLGGMAKQAYQARVMKATAARTPITFQFFKDTLRDLFVPPQQACNAQLAYTTLAWAKSVGPHAGWDCERFLAAHDVARTEAERHDVDLGERASADTLLRGLQSICEPAYDLVRLSHSHAPHATVASVKDRLRDRRSEVEAAVRTTARQQHAAPPALKPAGGVVKPAAKGVVIKSEGHVFKGTCFNCGQPGHRASECPKPKEEGQVAGGGHQGGKPHGKPARVFGKGGRGGKVTAKMATLMHEEDV